MSWPAPTRSSPSSTKRSTTGPKKLSEHLKPKSRAYHEIWLDGEKLVGPPEEEPILGPLYLPRKFKTGIVVPPQNDVDVFSQDLGFIAILDNEDLEEGTLLGFNLTVGGGLGATHGEPQTFPRVADVIGFLRPEQVLKVAETVVMIQRDFGDRTDRKHARLKYTIADRGVDWFKEELFKRLGFALEPPRAFEFNTQGDRFGWLRGHDGRWHLTLRIESGRVADRPGAPHLTGLEKIARIHQGDFRLTPNQNLIIANVAQADCMKIDQIVHDHGLGKALFTTPLRRDALACVALPTCGLAMAEAERYLPTFVDRVEELLVKQNMQGDSAHAAHHGMPQWLRAALPGGNRAHRPRSGPLHAATRWRRHRPAAERDPSRQYRRGVDSRRARRAVRALPRGTSRQRALR